MKNRGFALLELILVMMVIFILAGVVAPRFSDFFPSLQVRKTTGLFLAWAQKARSDAALTGARQRLVVDPAQRQFWIAYEARPLKEPGVFEVLGGAWGRESFPEEVEFASLEGFKADGDRRYLEFHPDGTARDATIVLSNSRGDRQTLKVVGATSRVYVEPPPEP